MTVLLGVDAGNTKTIALVAAPDGRIVGAGRSLGCADLYAAASEDAALGVVVPAVREALSAAGATPADVHVAVFSMAGADWPEDFGYLAAELATRLDLSAVPAVVNDGVGGLAGAVPEGPAVVVTLGTGAATAARGADGRTWHSSWWQGPQGAHELSRKAIAAVVRADLGIEPPTSLRDRVMGVVGEADVEAVLHRFTARHVERPRVVAQLCRALLDEADRGDAAAQAIVIEHGTALGEVAAAAARRVGIGGMAFDTAFTGGLVRAGASSIVDVATTAVRAREPEARVVEPCWDPVVGALLLAMDRAGVGAPDVLDRLRASLPFDRLVPGDADARL